MLHLTLRVKPNAKKSAFLGVINGMLTVSLKAPAYENKANKELVNFLSEVFAIPKSEIEIIRGHKAVIKFIAVFDNATALEWLTHLNG